MSEYSDTLTRKEQEVYDAIINNIEGLKNKDLAKKLEMSRSTFCTHLMNIYYKTRTNSQIELIVKYYRERINENNRNNWTVRHN